MPPKLITHHAKKSSCSVNARQYNYEGDWVQVPLSRNGFFKIWLIENNCRIHVNDQSYTCNGPVLFFANPLVSYAYDSLQNHRSGYWCIFKDDFLTANDPSGKLRTLPALDPAYAAVIFPNPEQLINIKWLFEQLIQAVQSEFAFRNEVVFNYIQLLLFEGIKAAEKPQPERQTDAAARITRQFLQLLEKQFPIQSPGRPIKLNKAGDFAAPLAIHINHLNAMLRKVTGQTTTQHIAARKIAEAKVLLRHTDWTIADISASLGFDYPNHFNEFFRRNTGMTPLGYRKEKIL